MANSVDNSADILDTRDIVARIDELDGIDVDDRTEDETTELATLRSLIEDISGYAGDRPEDGIGLIRDDYFERYAQEFAKDIGAIKRSADWPYTCIDWEQAAAELQADYTSVEWDGVTSWYR